MPLDTPPLLPAPWCQTGTALPRSADTRTHAAADLGLRLDTLPNELLSSIAGWLDKRAIVALAETSGRLHALLHDAVTCIRLERDIRHAVTPREFARLATRILDVKPSEQLRLIRQLGNRRHQLHPLLLPKLQLGLPDNGAAVLLGTLVTSVSARDPVRWFAVLQEALRFAERQLPVDGACRIRLLSRIATALGADGACGGECDAQRRSLWERLLALWPGLPAAQRRALFGPLAQYATYELRSGADSPTRPGAAMPAWLAMLDTMLPLLEKSSCLVHLLSAMIDCLSQWQDTPELAHALRAIVHREPALQQDQRASVLHSALEGYVTRTEAAYEPIWNAALLASGSLEPQHRAPLLATLASMITNTLEALGARPQREDGARHSCWNAVFVRTMRLAPELRMAPAIALTHAAGEIDDIEQCMTKLFQLAKDLPEADRGALLTAMLQHDYAYRIPRLWKGLVNLIVALPVAVYPAPWQALTRALATRYYMMREASGYAVDEGLGPTDSVLGAWPCSIEDALEQASSVLRMLPAWAAGAVLDDLAALGFPFTEAICWTFRQLRRFQPNQPAYKAAIVTKACASLARTCHASQLNNVMPEAWQTMLSLPVDRRACALQFLQDLLRRHHALAAWLPTVSAAIAQLPDGDDPTPHSHKRKAPPQ